MRTVTIAVTDDHIQYYGENIGSPSDCPIYHAARDAGLDVQSVWYETIFIHQDATRDELIPIALPPEVEDWQRDNVTAYHNHDRLDFDPITFTVLVPE